MSEVLISQGTAVSHVATFQNVTLEGQAVRLQPLSEAHLVGLGDAIMDGELWKLSVTLVPPITDLPEFLANAKWAQKSGDGLVFAIIDKVSGKVAGSTRFMQANLAHKRVEIGFTFLGKTFQKTPINTEAKLLLLTHAFEVLGLHRVQFITDYLNVASRNAICRIGATQEGVLRQHMLMRDGRIRDSVIYSVVANEWSSVKSNLQNKLAEKRITL